MRAASTGAHQRGGSGACTLGPAGALCTEALVRFMPNGGGYARVYYSIADDEKFEHIFEDYRHLATWLRLLLIADQMYPGHPPIPIATRRSSLDALVRAELVDLM